MNNVRTPTHCNHWRTAFAANSGPLSLRICVGTAVHTQRCQAEEHLIGAQPSAWLPLRHLESFASPDPFDS
jgi:hypothetical protein